MKRYKLYRLLSVLIVTICLMENLYGQMISLSDPIQKEFIRSFIAYIDNDAVSDRSEGNRGRIYHYSNHNPDQTVNEARYLLGRMDINKGFHYISLARPHPFGKTDYSPAFPFWGTDYKCTDKQFFNDSLSKNHNFPARKTRQIMGFNLEVLAREYLSYKENTYGEQYYLKVMMVKIINALNKNNYFKEIDAFITLANSKSATPSQRAKMAFLVSLCLINNSDQWKAIASLIVNSEHNNYSNEASYYLQKFPASRVEKTPNVNKVINRAKTVKTKSILKRFGLALHPDYIKIIDRQL